MTSQPDSSNFPSRFAIFLAGLVVISSFSVLLGWVFDIVVLKSIFLPQWGSMKVNTAICFILSGISISASICRFRFKVKLAKLAPYLSRIAARLSGLIGFLSLLEYLCGFDIGIDQWLFPDQPDMVNTPYPGRMAPETALCFILLAIAVELLKKIGHKSYFYPLSSMMSFLVLNFASAAMLTYFSPQLGEFGWFGLPVMAIHTAVLFTLLAIALIKTNWCHRPEFCALNPISSMLFAGAIFILLNIGITISRAQFSLFNLSQQIFLNEKMNTEMESILAEIIAAQSNNRGYIITEDTHFLRDYELAKKNTETKLAQLRTLELQTKESGYKARFTTFEQAIKKQQDKQQQVMLAKKARMSEKEIDSRTEESNHFLLRLQVMFAQHKNWHTRQNTALQQKSNNISRLAYLITFIGTFISLLMFLTALFKLNTAIRIRNQNEQAKQQEQERIEAFLNLAQMYNEPLEKIEKWVMEHSSQQTTSELAFCGMLDEKDENMTAHIWSDKVLFECQVEPPLGKAWVFPLKDAGLWAETVRRREPVLVNDYTASDVEGKHGTPVGHIPLRRFLGMPVIEGKKVLAVISVANKIEPYTDEDVFHLRFLAEGLRRTLCHRRDAQALQQSEMCYRGLFNSVTEAIYVLDEECRFLDVNQSVELMYQHPKDFFIGNTPAIVSAPDKNDFLKVKTDIQKAFAGKPQQFEFWGVRSNGEIFPKEVHLSKGCYFGKTVVIATACDITERKQAENDLRIAATAFESQEGIIISDAQSTILRVNRAFTEITGYTAEEVVGKNPRLLQSGRHNADFYTSLWENLNLHDTWKGEVWNKRKNGEVYPEYLTITAVKDHNGKICNYVASFLDITVSKAAAEEIQRLAFYDPLTGLPNRVLLRDRLKSALASSNRNQKKGALLFIDLDNFKNLNDTQGHDVGDLLLQQVAQRLSECVRDNDTCGRLGGDEFVVILEDLNENAIEAAYQTEQIGNKILASLNQSYLLNNQNFYSSSSIGVTVFSGYQKNEDELLKQADIAMYQAKTAGRNNLCFFDPQIQKRINAHAELETDLRQAIKEKQFILYYQTQVLNSGEVVSAEVLVRWQHPQRGMISPIEFIPLAEESNLILAIGEWVLETACHQLKRWESDPTYQKLQLAVNVSARQFGQAGFVEQVIRIIDRIDIRPERLKLELTESLVLIDVKDTIQKMQALREIGVQFSMDDFGTGYSSLAYLSRLPLNQLKIDQSFVRNISINQSDAVIVQTIIGMAHNLGMDVIAEGVETEEQKLFLKQNLCPLYQGYLFSKPVPVEQFETLVQQH